jgi:hypothetical protein
MLAAGGELVCDAPTNVATYTAYANNCDFHRWSPPE